MRSLSDSTEQPGHSRVQRLGKCMDGRNRKILLTALHSPDVGSMQPEVGSPCSAIKPCALTMTLPAGNGSYTLVAQDTVTHHFMTFLLSRQFRAPRYSLLSEPLEVECFATGKIGQTCLNGEDYPLTRKRLKNPPKTGAVLGIRAVLGH
jgi:hypothetical protein